MHALPPRSIKFIALTFALLLTACGGNNEGSGSLVGLPKSGNSGGSNSPAPPDSPEPPSVDGKDHGFILRAETYSYEPSGNIFEEELTVFMTSDRRLFVHYDDPLHSYTYASNQPLSTLWSEQVPEDDISFVTRDGGIKVHSLDTEVKIMVPREFAWTGQSSAKVSRDEIYVGDGRISFNYDLKGKIYKGTISFEDKTFHLLLREPPSNQFFASYEISGDELFNQFLNTDRAIYERSVYQEEPMYLESTGHIRAGSLFLGCDIHGQFKRLNPIFNEFEITDVVLQGTDCEYPGNYEGVTFFETESSTTLTTKQMHFFFYNDNTFIGERLDNSPIELINP